MSGNVRRESNSARVFSTHCHTSERGSMPSWNFQITRREEPSRFIKHCWAIPHLLRWFSQLETSPKRWYSHDCPSWKPSFRLGISQLDMFDKTAAVSITGVNSPFAAPGSIALRTWHECLSTLQLQSCRWRCYKNCSGWFSLLTYIYMYIHTFEVYTVNKKHHIII